VYIMPEDMLSKLSGFQLFLCECVESIKNSYIKYYISNANNNFSGDGADWNKLNRFVTDRDGRACILCGSGADKGGISVRHIKAREHGGQDEPRNLITICKACGSPVAPRQDIGILENIYKKEPWIITHHLEGDLDKNPLKEMIEEKRFVLEKDKIADGLINLVKSMADREQDRNAGKATQGWSGKVY